MGQGWPILALSLFKIERQPVKVLQKCYISFATESTSLKSDELTPGRFKVVACDYYGSVLTSAGKTSPIMQVIGFDILASSITKVMDYYDPIYGNRDSIFGDMLRKRASILTDRWREIRDLYPKDAFSGYACKPQTPAV